jgi:hypothetical protein
MATIELAKFVKDVAGDCGVSSTTMKALHPTRANVKG